MAYLAPNGVEVALEIGSGYVPPVGGDLLFYEGFPPVTAELVFATKAAALALQLYTPQAGDPALAVALTTEASQLFLELQAHAPTTAQIALITGAASLLVDLRHVPLVYAELQLQAAEAGLLGFRLQVPLRYDDYIDANRARQARLAARPPTQIIHRSSITLAEREARAQSILRIKEAIRSDVSARYPAIPEPEYLPGDVVGNARLQSWYRNALARRAAAIEAEVFAVYRDVTRG